MISGTIQDSQIELSTVIVPFIPFKGPEKSLGNLPYGVRNHSR